jgi:hypothetical protein
MYTDNSKTKVQENKVLHSSIVGGSTAARVINCPASVNLCAKMPPKQSSEFADRGTLLHDAISLILDNKETAQSVIGMTYENQVLTQELYDEKIAVALDALNDIDSDRTMEFMVETKVGFGDLLPGVFGSADLLGRIGERAIVLDWKFGDGVAVEAEENYQGMFYAAAAMHTPDCDWVFKGAKEVEIIIVQPPSVKRWVTTFERIKQFERDLQKAVVNAKYPTAQYKVGSHCRWCQAKPICPQMTGAVDRAVKVTLDALPAESIGSYLQQAELLEQWISDLRGLAFAMLEKNVPVPGYKLVAKRAARQWLSPENAALVLLEDLPKEEVYEASLISPAKAEKALKKLKKPLPDDLVVSISSGSTLASESDPRPAILQIGRQISEALSKLQ